MQLRVGHDLAKVAQSESPRVLERFGRQTRAHRSAHFGGRNEGHNEGRTRRSQLLAAASHLPSAGRRALDDGAPVDLTMAE
jgi:hypothetical protein